MGKLLFMLALGMVATSFGSIFVRWAGEAPSLTIAWYRMTTAALVFTPFYLWQRWSRPAIETRARPSVTLLAGLALALHFAFWVSSLRFTSVAVSTLLVTTSPALVAVAAYLFLREKTSAAGWAGIGLSFSGAALLLWGDFRFGDWRGPVLALGGALMVAVYWVAGRGSRRAAGGLLAYVYPVYVSAAVVLGVIVLAAGLPVTGFSTVTFLALLGAGLVPQCIGHTAYNWALGHLPATTISTLVLSEPILASLLAWWLLGESPANLVLVGGGLVAAGILIVSLWGRAERAAEASVAVGILRAGGRVFVQRRREPGPLDGLLEFPGGKIETEETPLAAVLREVREETGLEVEAARCRLLLEQPFRYPDRRVRLFFFSIDLDHQPELAGGSWERAARLDPSRFPAANRRVIEMLKGSASE